MPAHAHCEKAEEVGGDGDGPVLAGKKGISTLFLVFNISIRLFVMVWNFSLNINIHLPMFRSSGTSPSSIIWLRKVCK